MKLPALLLLLLVSTGLQAQHETLLYNRIGIGLGVQQTQLLDVQFSPLVYQANEAALAFLYDGKHNRSNWNTLLSFSTGSMFLKEYADRKIYNTTEDIYGNISSDSFFVRGTTRTVNLQLGYEYDVLSKENWSLSTGIGIREQLMYPSTFVNVGIINTASVLVTATMRFHPDEKNEWSAGVSVPAIGFNSRFPYSGTVSQPKMHLLAAFFDGTRFTSLDHYQQINLQLAYRHQLSGKWGIGAQYDFMWMHDDQPLALKLFSNGFAASIDYSF